MKLRARAMSAIIVGLIVMSVVALRAAEDKSKAKGKEAEDPGIVKFTAAPAVVQKTFRDEVKGGKIELLGKGINDKGITFFKCVVGIGQFDYEIAVGEDGMLLEKILQMARADATVEDCPPAVLKTLKEEAKTAKIEAVEKVSEGKRNHFVIDVALQKAKYQIIIAEDGALLSKIIDYDQISDVVPPPMEAKGKGTGTSRN